MASTRPRYEKEAAQWMEGLGMETYLPLVRKIRKYRSRKKVVDLPLFPRYLFVRTSLQSESHIKILRTPGILGLVSFGGAPKPVDDIEIESLRILVAGGSPLTVLPDLVEGRWVKVVDGPLAGAVGVIKEVNREKMRLVVNITLLGRSVSVLLSPVQVEVLDL